MVPKPAAPDDIPMLKALHPASWRDAYGAFLPPDVLGKPAEAHMNATWDAGHVARRKHFVVRPEGRPAGFVSPRREDDGSVLVENLHVAAPVRGLGLGRRLMDAAAKVAADRPVWLCVIDANTRARAIYAAWGGVEGAPFDVPFLGITVQERRVEWPMGHALAHLLRVRPQQDRRG